MAGGDFLSNGIITARFRLNPSQPMSEQETITKEQALELLWWHYQPQPELKPARVSTATPPSSVVEKIKPNRHEWRKYLKQLRSK